MKKLKAIRASLDKKIEKVDNYLGLFKAAMSNLNRKISRVQGSITSQREILENLVAEQLSLTNWMNSNPGISIIEVTGTLKAGTRVAGQHTVKIIQETLRGATIKEVCISDQEKTCRWEMTVVGK